MPGNGDPSCIERALPKALETGIASDSYRILFLQFNYINYVGLFGSDENNVSHVHDLMMNEP